MIKSSFSENIDFPRLEHVALTLIKANTHILDDAFNGDEILTLDNLITNQSKILNLREKMIREGRFVFGWAIYDIENGKIWLRIAIEKFEVRRSFLGPKYGFWAEINFVGNVRPPAYLVSKSLVDLNTKLFSTFVRKSEAMLVEKDAAIQFMLNL